jgi:hypothetical protein
MILTISPMCTRSRGTGLRRKYCLSRQLPRGKRRNRDEVPRPTRALRTTCSEGAPGPNGDTRRNGCVGTINALKGAGGSARYLLLPEVGQKGNSHMLMLDKNSLAIADLIIGWIGENVRGM